MYDIIVDEKLPSSIQFTKLLSTLHDIEFTYTIRNDENRYCDGVDLRYRFAIDNGYEAKYKDILGILDGPCTVLEMMIALALRMEENIMDNTEYGNRTGQWFWQMISSLRLNGQWNMVFDEGYVRDTVQCFLDRKYDRNGKGGLFTVRNTHKDLRKYEIWYQMNWYLDTIT